MSKKVKQEGMTEITRTITSIMSSFIVMFGVYLACYGHLTPGGGFAGG